MAGAIAAAILALINLSVYLITKRERRKPSEPYARADPLRVTSAGVSAYGVTRTVPLTAGRSRSRRVTVAAAGRPLPYQVKVVEAVVEQQDGSS